MVLHQAIQAARDGDLEALRDLASSAHLSPPISDSQGAGPVHHAARCGRLHCLQFLVSDLGLPADPRASNGATPAHDAAATGNIRELQWLVDRGGCNTQVSPSTQVWVTAVLHAQENVTLPATTMAGLSFFICSELVCFWCCWWTAFWSGFDQITVCAVN